MKLSVITINYNNLDGLKKTAESVLNQTWTDYEWIIVDGGSTDGSKEYIEKLAETLSHEDKITGTSWDIERFSLLGFTAKDMEVYVSDSPIKEKSDVRKLLWCSEPDKGIYNAMNKGIAKASGEYLNFMNSGDCFYDSGTLDKVRAYLEKGYIDIYYGELIFSNGTEEHTFNYPELPTTHYLVYRSLGHPTTFMKSSLLKEIGYCEDYTIVSDWEKFLKWFRQGRSFKHMDLVVAVFDTTGISTTNYDKLEEEKERVYLDVFGKENIEWVKESIEMQKLYEEYNQRISQDFLRIKHRNGIRLTFLSLIMKIINKTF